MGFELDNHASKAAPKLYSVPKPLRHKVARSINW
jgi:hypothetical protein